MGWTFNTADPDAPTLGPIITGVAIALTCVSLITVVLRMYVRFGMIKAAGIGEGRSRLADGGVPLTCVER